MTTIRTAALAALGAIALAGCSQAASDNHTAAANASAAAATVNSSAANAAGNGQSVSASGTDRPASTSLSSGMPVPGTNTPEHIVVNQDAANASANRQ